MKCEINFSITRSCVSRSFSICKWPFQNTHTYTHYIDTCFTFIFAKLWVFISFIQHEWLPFPFHTRVSQESGVVIWHARWKRGMIMRAAQWLLFIRAAEVVLGRAKCTVQCGREAAQGPCFWRVWMCTMQWQENQGVKEEDKTESNKSSVLTSLSGTRQPKDRRTRDEVTKWVFVSPKKHFKKYKGIQNEAKLSINEETQKCCKENKT